MRSSATGSSAARARPPTPWRRAWASPCPATPPTRSASSAFATPHGTETTIRASLPAAPAALSRSASVMASHAPSPLSALSPLDGRYAPKVAALRPLMSEYGLMHRRVQVEVEWFIALSDAGFAEFKPLSESARGLLRGLVVRFSE